MYCFFLVQKLGGWGEEFVTWYIAETASTEPTKHGLHLVPSFTLLGSMTRTLFAHWLPCQSARGIFLNCILVDCVCAVTSTQFILRCLPTSYLLLQSWVPELFR